MGVAIDGDVLPRSFIVGVSADEDVDESVQVCVLLIISGNRLVEE